MHVYLIKEKDTLVGIFNNLENFFKPEILPDNVDKKKFTIDTYNVEKIKINKTLIKANRITFKGDDYDISNLDEPIPLLDVSDPTFL